MTRQIAKKLLQRLKKAQHTISEVIGELEAYLQQETTESANKHPHGSKDALSYDDASLKQAWEAFNNKLVQSKNPDAVVSNFFKSKPKSYIQRLIAANNLPVDTRVSKQQQIKQLVQLVKVGQAIRGNSHSQKPSSEPSSSSIPSSE